ncbi:hypothetical protein AAIA72_03100 [Hahella sp. SMD15-11]|uniref:DUF4861 domain-containing protein n=1 Tax=Thermohahella caldifontis TaxID=3142973 RepID=A0AB39UY38_9GAMM
MKTTVSVIVLSLAFIASAKSFELVYESPLKTGDMLRLSGKDIVVNKTRPAILYDAVESVIENGTIQGRDDVVYDGFLVQRGDSATDLGWDKPSNPGFYGSVNVKVVSSEGSAWESDKYVYYVKGHKGYLGWPRAYTDYTNDNKKIYVSWWLKQRYDTKFYYVLKLKSVDASFQNIKDSELELEDGTIGKLINYSDNEVHVEFSGVSNASSLVGKKVTQKLTGAQAVFDIDGAMSSGNNKYIRIWEHPNGDQGIRLSWTNANLGAGGAEDWLYSLEKVAPKPGQWNHMEVFVDGASNTANSYVNGIKQASIDWSSGVEAYKDISGMYSPTIALIGFDGKIPVHQETYFDNIYMDNDFERVVISKDSVLTQGSEYIVQPIIKRQNGEITVMFNPGFFQPGTYYVHYIKGEEFEGDVGVPFCYKCEIPKPSSPTSYVE